LLKLGGDRKIYREVACRERNIGPATLRSPTAIRRANGGWIFATEIGGDVIPTGASLS